ncbi:tetratricopeptide repeat protein [Lysobacter silvisoli]|uniref:Tetratricopeptide repeat protein n=1 Tax=Lysobacter silvisoli TaxID=2293254 RepID=A0A371K2T8_9GAMM|nr:hypothetical protein [Lysobacter silvisoli]RDZ28180.1 hypothetical protein DX914_03280 [Lysobacter silvisoli]
MPHDPHAPATAADDARPLDERAYAAFDEGRLSEASTLFARLLQLQPETAHYHYMRGLAHKYLLDWPTSLRHNLNALTQGDPKEDEPDEAALWNAGIAATALGDWARARELWNRCGIQVPAGQGPIEADFGVASIRLNPWSDGETLFARRIDVVRARLLNVPLPESGYRYGDIVLHDGASTGERTYGNQRVPVLNALARLEPSQFRTYVVFVHCDGPEDIEALRAMSRPGIADVEDWSASIVNYCMRCSYGAAHAHREDDAEPAWDPERSLGIAAQGRSAVDQLLRDWAGNGAGRRIDSVSAPEHAPPPPQDGHVWWRGPDDDSGDPN